MRRKGREGSVANARGLRAERARSEGAKVDFAPAPLQMLGHPGEVWAPEAGADRLVVYRTR